MKYATDAFGSTDIRRLSVRELRAWRARLPKGSARGIHQALRQTLQYAVDIGLLDENPANRVPNPEAKREEIRPFASWSELESLADEIDQRYAALPIFAAATGLRPEEWIALERADIDRQDGVVHVRRTFAYGNLKSYGKTDRSRRRVPLTGHAIGALDRSSIRIDSPLLFPSPTGDHINLNNWRRRAWKPALAAAGLEHRRIYDLRHTFATFAIAARAGTLYELARFMGTSVQMIDRTYGHLFDDTEAEFRARFEAWDARQAGKEAAR